MEISVLLAINIILRNTYKHNCKQLIYINTVCISYKTSYFQQDAIFVSINYKNRFCKMSINMNNYCNQNITWKQHKLVSLHFNQMVNHIKASMNENKEK